MGQIGTFPKTWSFRKFRELIMNGRGPGSESELAFSCPVFPNFPRYGSLEQFNENGFGPVPPPPQ